MSTAVKKPPPTPPVTDDLSGVSWLKPELRSLRRYHLELAPCRFKLDQNEVLWDVPRRVKEEVVREWLETDWSRYPDFHGDELRRDLGKLLDWPAEGILVGNGSNELLALTLRAFVRNGSGVLGADPTFGLYRSFILQAGGRPEFLPPTEDLRLPFEALRREVIARPDRPLILCSPNNPTGDALTPSEVETLLERLAAPLLLDNAYAEFCGHDYSALLRRYPHLILFRTFSKAWGLGSQRVGVLVAQPEMVEELIRVKLPYNLARVSALAARAVLANPQRMRRQVSVTLGRRGQWSDQLAGLGFEVFPSQGNFLLFRVGVGPDAAERAARLHAFLEGQSIRLRDVGGYPGLRGCLRVTVGTGRALRAVVEAVQRWQEDQP